MNRRKVMVVLGMHRSATSAVAKGLHLAGFPMGTNMIGPHRSNPWGHFEDRKLVGLNDLILSSMGARWDNPPRHGEVLNLVDVWADSCSAYIDDRGPGQWGMKDPRLVLLWPVWKCAFARHADIEPIVVKAWRNPHDVAESLHERDGMDIDDGYRLAVVYQEQLQHVLP